MRTIRLGLFALVCLALLGGFLRAEPAPKADLSGRWVLAEQTYEQGGGNLAERSPRLYLDVETGEGRADVRVWNGADIRRALPWPAATADGARAAQVEVIEKSVDAKGGQLTAHYRILPPDPGGLTLELRETYIVSEDGATLSGSLTVEMSRDGEPRGGYTLHRRFVREPR